MDIYLHQITRLQELNIDVRNVLDQLTQSSAIRDKCIYSLCMKLWPEAFWILIIRLYFEYRH